jgi:hypothetical protein
MNATYALMPPEDLARIIRMESDGTITSSTAKALYDLVLYFRAICLKASRPEYIRMSIAVLWARFCEAVRRLC